MSQKLKHIAGIDLGTTNSCIGIWKDDRVTIVCDAQGKRTFPSVVSFTNTGRLYGSAAVSMATKNAKNTVFDAKRMIGHEFNQDIIKEELEHWPFKVIADAMGRPSIEVEYNGGIQVFKPEAISSMIISYLVETAKQYSGDYINDIVITCPAYFNDNQRQATKHAGEIAGYNVLSVLNEPTAAAIAYGMETVDGEKNILVYDLGGGTFDVTILGIENKNYTVLGTDGDTHCGGDDLDYVMMDIIKEILNSKGITIDLNDKKKLMRLRQTAEQVKIGLSSIDTFEVSEDTLWNQESFLITRGMFEEKAESFFARTINVVKRLLADRHMNPSDIDDIVLIGGSSHIPRIKTILSDMFGEKKISKQINPDEAVAMGATIKAIHSDISDNLQIDDMMESLNFNNIPDINIIDVVPLSLGVKTAEGKLSTIIPKNTQYPCTFKKNYTNSKDGMIRMKIRVYQGERVFVKDDYAIGLFTICDMTPMPMGEGSVDVSMSIDSNGILTVTAHDIISDKETSVTFDKHTTNLSPDEVKEMIVIAEENRRADEENVEKMRMLNDIELAALYIQKILSDETNVIDDSLRQQIMVFINETKAFSRDCGFDIETVEQAYNTSLDWLNMINEMFGSGN